VTEPIGAAQAWQSRLTRQGRRLFVAQTDFRSGYTVCRWLDEPFASRHDADMWLAESPELVNETTGLRIALETALDMIREA
jgi:hypothetical protein